MKEIVLTYSELSAMRFCPNKHELGYIEGYRLKIPSVKLRVGSIGHEAMAVYWKSGGDKDRALEAFDEAMQEDFERILAHNPKQDVLDKNMIRYHSVRAAFRVYLDTDGPKHMDEYKIVSIEDSFKIPILHPDTHNTCPKAYFAGKFDVIAEGRKSGKLVLIDHKFLSQFNEDINQLEIDLQMTVYHYAISRILQSPVAYIRYNVIKKPRYKKKDDEPLQDFEDRVYSKLLDRGGTCSSPKLVRGKTSLIVAEREIYRGYRDKRKRLREHERGTLFSPRNQGMHCGWMCSFRDICMERDPFIIDQKYEKKSREHEELEKDLEESDPETFTL